MTEIKLNGLEEHQNQDQSQLQEHPQQENGRIRLPSQQAEQDYEAVFVATQYADQLEYPVKVVVKDSGFKNPILKLPSFRNKNGDQEQKICTLRMIGTLIMLAILFITFCVSAVGFFAMWFTDMYNNQFTTKLVLANNSQSTEWWIRPPLSTHLKVHIFNYTNIDDFLSGRAKKLKVEDLGPYTYSENATKTQVQFNDNSTVTFKVNRAYTFMPEYSSGKQYDQVVVPNIPLISTLAAIKYNSYFIRSTTAFGVQSTSPKLFTTVAADSLLWGYKDSLVDFINAFKPFDSGKFGLLTNRNGTSRDTLQIYTGESDLKKLGVISQFNGQQKLKFWSTDICNSVDGTDGSQFPPHLMDKKQHLEVFIQAMCRKVPLEYDSEVNLFEGVPAWRYKTPADVFHHPDLNSQNQCFCHIESGVCPPSGVFNGTVCYDGAPIYVSFPHFFGGDPILYEPFDGIKPVASIHQTFADIHPRLAFPIGGASRIQINVELDDHEFYRLQRGNLKKNIILPVMWLEITSGEINDELRTLIYHSTFSANAIQLALKYGTLLVTVTLLALLVAGCYFQGKNPNQVDDLK